MKDFKLLGLSIFLAVRACGTLPEPTPMVFGVDALMLNKKATITITNNPEVPSPFFPGEFTVNAFNQQTIPASGSGRSLSPAHIEAVVPDNPPLRAFFDSNNNHRVDAFSLSPTLYPRSTNTEGSLQAGGAYLGSAQNIVIIAQFSSWSTVVRPQFIALHLQTSAGLNQPITQSSILSANLIAGDLLNNAPLPGNASMQGLLLTPNSPIQLNIQEGAVPGPNHFGSIRGLAEGDVFFTNADGQVFGSHVKFDFWSWITNDIDSNMIDAHGPAKITSTALPGP